jgi:hypothetical protein
LKKYIALLLFLSASLLTQGCFNTSATNTTPVGTISEFQFFKVAGRSITRQQNDFNPSTGAISSTLQAVDTILSTNYVTTNAVLNPSIQFTTSFSSVSIFQYARQNTTGLYGYDSNTNQFTLVFPFPLNVGAILGGGNVGTTAQVVGYETINTTLGPLYAAKVQVTATNFHGYAWYNEKYYQIKDEFYNNSNQKLTEHFILNANY